MVIQGIYVQGYRCIALHLTRRHDNVYPYIRYTAIQKLSSNNPFCSSQLYNPILSIALQVIYSPKASVVMSGIFGRDKCAANLVMAMGLRCTADFQVVNHPNSSFSFPFCQRFATVGSRLCPRHETDAMSCDSCSRSHRSLRNAPIRVSAIPNA